MQDEIPQPAIPGAPQPEADLSVLSITLLKGALYREDDERLWMSLLGLQARVRDYLRVLGLELAIDEAEGYAFLRSPPEPEDDETAPRPPRLVARRPLSFPVSLLLALLRRKLAEFDAGSGDTRLVLTRDEIGGLLRVFLPESSNEVRLLDQIETHINRIVDLGFLRRLKTGTGPASFEVRRILKAYIDAPWLADLDARLAAYQARLEGEVTGSSGDE